MGVRKKKKIFRRRKKEKIWFQHPRARFPRWLRYPRLPKGHETDLQLLPLLRKMREEYPVPYYDPWFDGSSNRGEVIIAWAFNMPIEQLKDRCLFHGLSQSGTRFEMIRALYLHYRSRRLEKGFPLVAYGLHHENTDPPQCDCGKVRKPSEKIKRFPRLPIRRFPRLQKRFPRLPPKGLNVKPESETRFMMELSVTDPKRYMKLLKAMGHDKI